MKSFNNKDKKVSLTRQSFLFSVIVIFFLSFANGINVYLSQSTAFDRELQRDETLYLQRELQGAKNEITGILSYVQNKRSMSRESLEEALKKRVLETRHLAESLFQSYNQIMDQEQLRELISHVLRNLRYHDGRGYYFVYNMDGMNEVLPTQPELEGTDLWDLKDASGSFTIQKAAAIAASPLGQGAMNWYWYKPGETEEMYKKTGYIAYFEPYDWFIGTGEYLYDIDKDLQAEILNNLDKMYAGAERYIFIGKGDGTILMAPYEIDNFHDLKKPDGSSVWNAIKEIAHNNAGFVEYRLPENALGYSFAKTSYVAHLPDWDWYVGAGVDMDKLASENTVRRESLKELLMRNLLIGLLLFFATFAVALLLFAFHHRNLHREFAIMDTFLANASEDYHPLDSTRFRYLELFNLAETANRMIEEIKKQRLKLKDYSEHMEHLARIDSLTRLLNHRAVMENVQARVKEAERYKTPLSVIMIDIDNFKQINDRYGHPFGDKVLVRIADVFQGALRETDLTGRYGGEEFLVVLPNTDAESAFLAAEKIRKAIEALKWEKPDLTVTVSGGIAEYTGRHYHRLIGEADRKLYRAKAQGKNRMVK